MATSNKRHARMVKSVAGGVVADGVSAMYNLLETVGEEPSIGSLLLTVVIHLPLFRPLHTKAFLQKLRARRALLREFRGRIR